MSTTVFGISELMHQILQYADIQTLVNFGLTSRNAEQYMHVILTDLVRAILNPYICDPRESSPFSFFVPELTRLVQFNRENF